ncbi:MAG: Rieske 2Fe-2S domain-containing protein [Phycisphaeraceae bacterium]|nr:Rieske 2Fe-2S domain-containing protein [Phycisphaeraceae bacterium]
MNETPKPQRCCDGREPSAGRHADLRIHGEASGPSGSAGTPKSARAGDDTARGAAGDRRGFLFGAGAALMGIGGLLAAIPIVGTLFAPARRGNPMRWTDLGPVDQFPAGTTRLATFTSPNAAPTDGETARDACWVRSLGDDRFQVFYVNCAHLGCPVRWFEQSRLFMCPCHGGVYYEDGSRASGPPPRGLFTHQWRVTNGRLEILAGLLPGLEEKT